MAPVARDAELSGVSIGACVPQQRGGETLVTFFGTDDVLLSLDSQATGTTRSFKQLHEVVKDVEQARVLVGFHFHNSDLEGPILGRNVAGVVLGRFSRPRD
jgi:hypothetical protein